MVRILSDDTVDKIRTRCKKKNDVEGSRLVAGNFSELQTLEAKYHRNCSNLYLKQDKYLLTNKESAQDFLRDKNYEMHE